MQKVLEQRDKIELRIKEEIVYAYEYLNGSIADRDIDNFSKEIFNEFIKSPITAQMVIRGIKKGYMGYYGRTYREINFQEICVWIQCAKENCKPKNLERTQERL